MSPRTLIAFAVVASTAIAPVAYAEGKNEVRAVTFDEDAGITRVHVRGAQTPTFTVYKLEKPTRVVIDLPQARLADALRGHDNTSVFTPSTWAVSTIAAQQLDDGLVRIIVSMARPGRYDVKTDGNEVIVMVMPRDPAPKNASPEELAKVQAESERMKQLASDAEHARDVAQHQADAATATLKQSRAEADAAKAEAERLRKTATEQAAKADAAQRAVEQAKQLQQKNAATVADLERAKQNAAQAKHDADVSRTAAATAQAEADRTRLAAETARREAVAEADRAKADAAKARGDLQRMQVETERARADAAKQAVQAEQAVAQERATADQAKRDAAYAMTAADQARKDADQAKREASRTQAETAAAKGEVAKTRAEAAAAKGEVAKTRAEADAAKGEVAKAKDAVAKARDEASAARADAARARSEAESARADAELARTAAAADKKQAEADKHKAELERGDAEKLMKDARQQLVALDKKSVAAQQLEDKARATNAAAQAREEAARDAEARTRQERTAAELAAKQAKVAAASDRSDRAKAAAEAKAAEERLAMARKATEAAESLRSQAEQAAKAAKHDLETSKSALAGVEQQRTQAVAAASEAARKRGDAEAAASDAARRRTEAEQAAADAAKKRHEAELAATDAAQRKSSAERDRAEAEVQRVAALDAAKAAQVAKDAAEKQRKIAETAAQVAVGAKGDAETSLADLTAKRGAAERAAADLETRSKAEAKAQAEVAAAQLRNANDQSARAKATREQEIADARTELDKLAADRKRAETELSDRRKAVALQQAEAVRLDAAATQARDAANREEQRRAELAGKRSAEEADLARIEAAKAEAKRVKAQVAQVDAPKPDTKPTAASAKAAPAKVAAITFKGDDGNGQVDITVGADANVQIGEITATHVELIVDHAELAPKLERTLDVSKFGSPVRAVSSFRDRRTPNRVRLIAELSQPATPTVDRDGSAVRWHFISGDVAKRPVRVVGNSVAQDVPSPIVGGFGAASTPVAQQSVTQVPPQGGRRRIYHGATVDFDFKDAPIHDLLRVIADTGHISIVVPDTIDAKVTVRLKRVPWDQALEVILSSHGLWYRRDGNIYRVAPRKELDAEDEAENARREAAIKAEQPRPEVVTLNYASAEELKSKLEGMLSPKGKIEVDSRTNALIINDVAGNRAEIVRLALSLDTQTPQISIEARIVEARSTFLRQIGVQWGGNAVAGANGGNATGLIWPSNIGIRGGNEDQNTNRTGISSPSDFAVNLPAGTGTGEGGVLGFALGSIGGNLNINLRLSALEDIGTVRIISAPKVTVLNNKEARISQGVSIPISVVSAAGTNTQFVQADLALTVTPYVSQRDCAIAMNLVVTKNEPDFVNVGARGDPTILRKEARTSMLVQDGETTVLGGIYTRNTGLAYKKVPFFGDIPVLGWLFKNRRENDDRTEILVFITPKITNKASLHCTQ